MNKEQIIDFLRANPVCFLATMDGDHPRVRGMMLYMTGKGEIIFHTGKGKDLDKQLSENCAIELCAFDPKANVQVRVSGEAEFLADEALSQEIVNARPFLKEIVEKYGYEAMPLFRVKNPVANVWTMADAMAPKTYVNL